MDKIRVMLADDQRILREGLKTILEADEGILVVAMAENGKQALEYADKFHPHLVLMDIRMPEMNGVEATARLKNSYPDMVIIILTTFDDDEYIIEAMAKGASGYLLKDIDGDRLIQSVHDGMAGNIILPGKVAAKLAAHLSGTHAATVSSPHQEFTDREKGLLPLLVKGLNNREMAEKLYLTEGTVKNYLTSIYGKLGARDRTEAVLLLQKHGLV